MNLEQQAQARKFDVAKLKHDLTEKENDLTTLSETFEREYEVLRLENERNVKELQRAFKENIERTRTPSQISRANSSCLSDNTCIEEMPL